MRKGDLYPRSIVSSTRNGGDQRGHIRIMTLDALYIKTLQLVMPSAFQQLGDIPTEFAPNQGLVYLHLDHITLRDIFTTLDKLQEYKIPYDAQFREQEHTWENNWFFSCRVTKRGLIKLVEGANPEIGCGYRPYMDWDTQFPIQQTRRGVPVSSPLTWDSTEGIM